MIMDTIAKMENEHVKSINPTEVAQEEWVEMVDSLTKYTLFPLTNSWWNASNIPGKKVQMLTYILGIQQYEAQCRAILDEWKGFQIERENNKIEEKSEGIAQHLENSLPDEILTQ